MRFVVLFMNFAGSFARRGSGFLRCARVMSVALVWTCCAGGCGESRPPTFGELTGQPPVADDPEPPAPMKRFSPDDEEATEVAEAQKPRALAEVMADIVPGSKATTDLRVQALIKHPDAPLDVVDLNLGNTPVTDAGLEGIEKLASLVNLDLTGTNTTGDVVMKLKGLPALRTLKVGTSASRFNTPPFVDPADFPELRDLAFSNTRVKGDGASLIRQLKKLNRLEIATASVTDADLACVRPLADLEELNLSGNAVTDEGLVFLSGHPKLRSLNLSFTQVQGRGITALVKAGELQELTSLSVGHLTLTDEFAEALVRLSTLEHLDLSQTTCTDKGMTLLRAFKRLKSLNLAECNGIKGPGLQILGELPDLEYLYLDRNRQIEDQHLALLTAMKTLKYVGLRDTDCSPLGVAKLREFLPNCEIVGNEEE